MLPLCLAAGLSVLGDLSLYTALVTQLQLLQLTLVQVGILLSVHRLIRIPGNPLVGLMMDPFGRRRLFLLGMLLAVLSSAGYGLVGGFWPLLLMRLAWGAAWMLINVSSLTMILDIGSEATRGRLNGIYNIGMWGGFAVGPLLGGLLVDLLSFRTAMLVCAALSAVGWLIAWIWLPETRRAEVLRSPARPGVPGAPIRRHASPIGLARTLSGLVDGWRGALRGNPEGQRALLLFMLTQFAGDGIVLGTLTLLVKERLSQGVAIGSLVVGVATVSGILLMIRSLLAGASGLALGSLSDRQLALPGHMPLHGTSRLPLILGGLAGGAASFLLLAGAHAVWAILGGVVLGAAAGGAVLTTVTAFVGDHTPADHQGAMMGAYATAGDTGSTLGPALSFFLIPLIGLGWLYSLSAGLFVLAILFNWPGARAGRQIKAEMKEP